MKNFVLLLAVTCVVFFSKSCIRSDNPDPDYQGQDQGMIEISDILSVRNGTVHFKDLDSYNKLFNLLAKNPGKISLVNSYLEDLEFNSLEKFYKNVREEEFEPLFQTREMPLHLKKYFKVVKMGQDYDLEETVPETFFRAISNTDLSFVVANDKYVIAESSLILEKNYLSENAEIVSLRLDRTNGSDPNAKMDIEYVEARWYQHGGNHYKYFTKVICTNYSMSHDGPIYVQAEFKARHRKRSAWIYWPNDAPEIGLYGNFTQAMPGPPPYVHTLYLPDITLTNTDLAIWPGYNVRGFNITGWCKGHDNNIYDYNITRVF